MFGLITVAPLTHWLNEKLVDDALDRISSSASSPLQFPRANIWSAAKLGDLDALKVHVSNKTDLDAQDPHAGFTALSWAVLAGEIEIVDQLIKAGADVNAKNGVGTRPLHEAGFMGQDEIAALLLKKRCSGRCSG